MVLLVRTPFINSYAGILRVIVLFYILWMRNIHEATLICKHPSTFCVSLPVADSLVCSFSAYFVRNTEAATV